ncbi:MAG: NADH-quinone oxidoreductase subunit A [Cutibacterium granulosum]|nr:NADH-quinone oxidoreductase subunit A [Cutibacterium granulosum]
MNEYLPLVGLPILALLFVVVTISVNLLLSPTRKNTSKHQTFECGIQPTPQPPGGGRFPVKYCVIAMLYIVFDIEIVFLYPWAVTFNQLGAFGLIEMLLFIATIFVSYIYIFRRGGLDWD